MPLTSKAMANRAVARAGKATNVTVGLPVVLTGAMSLMINGSADPLRMVPDDHAASKVNVPQ